MIATLMILLFMVVADPARSEIYVWKDSEGITTFSDNPKIGPDPAKVELWSERPSVEEVSDMDLAEAESEDTLEELQRYVTQGEFVIQLARELGLGDNLGPEEAAQILSDIRIAPILGNWELNRALTPDLTSRLRTLTVAAAQMQWITVKPEQALMAFDTTSALLGVDIPLVTDKQVPESSQPLVDVPPLVYISPPPPLISSYYTWVPVSSGFLWYGTTVHGFFALHGVHLNAHFFNGHHFVFEPHFVQRHLVNHFVGYTAEPIHHVVHHRRDQHVAVHKPDQHLVGRHDTPGHGNRHDLHPTRQVHHLNSSSSHSSEKHIARGKHRKTRGGHMNQSGRHGLGHNGVSSGHGYGR